MIAATNLLPGQAITLPSYGDCTVVEVKHTNRVAGKITVVVRMDGVKGPIAMWPTALVRTR